MEKEKQELSRVSQPTISGFWWCKTSNGWEVGEVFDDHVVFPGRDYEISIKCYNEWIGPLKEPK